MLTKYLVDGTDLSTLPGVHYAPGTMLHPAIARRREVVEIRNRDGVTLPPLPPVYGPRQITIVVHVTSSARGVAGETELATRTADVAARLARAATLTRVHGTQSLATDCELEEVAETGAEMPDRIRTLTATYKLPKVFFRGAPMTTPLTPPNNQAGQGFAVLRPGAFAPISDVRATVLGPATFVKITDLQTSEWLSWTGTLTTGQTLVIDYATDTATIGAADASNGLDSSPYGNRFYPEPNGRHALQLVRTGGTNTITLTYSPHYF